MQKMPKRNVKLILREIVVVVDDQEIGIHVILRDHVEIRFLAQVNVRRMHREIIDNVMNKRLEPNVKQILTQNVHRDEVDEIIVETE